MRGSTDGSATKDVDGVAFLAKRIMDEDAREMDVLQIVLTIERCCLTKDSESLTSDSLSQRILEQCTRILKLI